MPYHILRADLTTGTTSREEVPPELVSRFLGGKGLAAHYLATELPDGADPLGPENLLIFMTGTVSGIFPGTCRHAVVTKSPATAGFLDTYAGGYFAWELRKAGLLGLLITGQAPGLCYLEVTDGEASIKDAADLAGLSIEADRRPAAVRGVPRGCHRSGGREPGGVGQHRQQRRTDQAGPVRLQRTGRRRSRYGGQEPEVHRGTRVWRTDPHRPGESTEAGALPEDPGGGLRFLLAQRRRHAGHRRLVQRRQCPAHPQLAGGVVR